MTLAEFKAWFEGFTEGIDGAPTEKQFKRIKAKVADIDGTPITYPIYIDRYVYPQWPNGIPYWTTGYVPMPGTTWGGTHARARDYVVSNGHLQAMSLTFDSRAAMHTLGVAEATLN